MAGAVDCWGILVACALVPVALLVTPPAAAEPAWHEQYSLPQTSFWSVDAVDADHVWAVCAPLGAPYALTRTADGGRTWQVVPLAVSGGVPAGWGSWVLDLVRFPDTTHGWIVGRKNLDPQGLGVPMVLRTTDGGSSWHELALPSYGAPSTFTYALAAVDGDRAWLEGPQGVLYRTVDGGAHWDPANRWSDGSAMERYLFDELFFSDADHGVAVSAAADPVHTTDGGVSWHAATIDGQPAGGTMRMFHGLTFRNALEGWDTGYDGKSRYLIHTVDGGANWQVIMLQSALRPYEMAFTSSSEGWGSPSRTGTCCTRSTEGPRGWPSRTCRSSRSGSSLSSTPPMAGSWGGMSRSRIWAYRPDEPAGDHQCFLDVPPTNPYYVAIEGLSHLGVIGGYEVAGGREFHPADTIKRAQYAKMICGVVGVLVTESSWSDAAKPFTDLDADTGDDLYPNDFVGAAFQAGITQGKTPTTFDPWNKITRAQVVTMVVRAGKLLRPGVLTEPPVGYVGSLPDFDSPDHAPNMRWAESNGLLTGVVGFGSSWNPYEYATRGEAARIMWNLLIKGTVRIFDSGNGGGALNGPSQPTVFTLDRPRYVKTVTTYHWNLGHGTSGIGMIGLRNAGDDDVLGPWAASGTPGQGGVPNAYWTVTVDRVLPAGTYTIVDSEPGTWARNDLSGGRGMAWVDAAP